MRRLLIALAVVALAAPADAVAGPGAARAGRGPVAIFYYPWYGTASRDGSYLHWQQGDRRPPLDVASSYYPARGAYSSADPAVLDAQMTEIAAAGVDTVVSSWWGWGSLEDARLPDVLAAARRHRLAVAVQIEPYAGRTAATVAADIAHLRLLGVSSFYVYRPEDVPDADWAALNASLADVTVLAQTVLAGEAAAGGFDGLYTYDVLSYGAADFARICAQAHALQLLCAPSVGPGYDALHATGDIRIKPRLDGATYDGMWRRAIAAGADSITITSYNEWHEGTQIEPARARATLTGFHFQDYSGAWGLLGRQAETAYLDRTAAWSALWRSGATELARLRPDSMLGPWRAPAAQPSPGRSRSSQTRSRSAASG